MNIGVALLKYYAELNLNQSGQYGQIYAEKFTSVSLILKELAKGDNRILFTGFVQGAIHQAERFL